MMLAATTIWDLLEKIPAVVVILIVAAIARAVKAAQKASAENEAGSNETEEQRRVREIQERIRRISAERRGQGPVPPMPPHMEQPRPTLRPVAETFERKVVDSPTPVEPWTPEPNTAELERQQRLAEELRTLRETRAAVERRVESLAVTSTASPEAERLTAARARLLQDLADPQSLRRAFVLREVLGAPVGLR